MKVKTINPYPKSQPQHWNAWRVGHGDGAAGQTHDPLGRGFFEIGLAFAYTKGYKAASTATSEGGTVNVSNRGDEASTEGKGKR